VSSQVLNISKDRDFTTSLGNPYQCLTVFIVFLCLNRISCILVCAHGLLSCHWAPLGRVRLLSLFFLREVLLRTNKILPSLPFSSLNSPSSLSLSSCNYCSSLNHLHGPLLHFLQYVQVSLVLWSSELGTAPHMCLTTAEQRCP